MDFDKDKTKFRNYFALWFSISHQFIEIYT